jgi:DNA-binding CsgD family transcriptional regulator
MAPERAAQGSPLFGREHEQHEVRALVEQLPRGGALVLRGAAGLGKSTLLADAARVAESAGVQVLRARGVESEAQVAFAGLEELLRPLRDRAGRLPPPQRTALACALGQLDTAVPDMFLIALATLNLIAEAAARTPVLILLEDGHWLDRATAEVVAFIARRLEFEPIALIIARRTGYPDSPDVTTIPSVDLSPLPEEAAAALLDDRFPDLPTAVRRRVLDEAAGNPLALMELPVGRVEDAVTTAGRLPLSERLMQAFGARTVGLPTAALTLLLIAAVDDGDAVSEILAAATTAGGIPLTVDDFSPAIAAGLIEVGAERLAFRHPLVRSAVLQRATAGDRQRAHAALARTLEGQIERRAWHRGASILGPDDAIAAELEAAGQRARRRGAAETAIAAFERAAHLSADPGQRADRLLLAADLAVEVGRRDSVLHLLGQVEPIDLTSAQRALAASIGDFLDDGLGNAAATVLRQAERAERIITDGDRDLGLKVLWNAAIRAYYAGADPELRSRLVAVVERAGGEPTDPHLLAILAFVDPIGSGARLQARLPAAMARAAAEPNAARRVGDTAQAIGAFEEGLAMQAIAIAGLRAQGRLALLARSLSVQAGCALNLLNLGVAIPSAQEAVRLSRETSQPAIRLLAHARESVIAALLGEHDTSERIAVEVEREALPARLRPVLALVQQARGLSALGVGRYSDAFEHFRRVYDPADPAAHVGHRALLLGDVIEAGLRSGRREETRGLWEEMEAEGLRTPSPVLHINLRHARALIADATQAEELFRSALGEDLSGWPFARARLQLSYGEWLRRNRRPADARGHLRTAREAFDALGVLDWGERARTELRASGETSRQRVPQARELLTPQELQIAQMAAEGLTNREIGQKLYLSHRTISTHLHRIFPKLGVTSRAGLGGALSSG